MPGQRSETMVKIGMTLDHSEDARHASLRGRYAAQAGCATAGQFQRQRREFQADLFPFLEGALLTAGAYAGCQRRQLACGRYAYWEKTSPAAPDPGFGDEFVKVRRVVREGKAAVADAVFVAALERLAGVAQQQRAWRHQLTAAAGPVLKGAFRHQRHAHL